MSWKEQFPKDNVYFETENGILYCGDSRDILSTLPKESIDLVVTSPPYDNLRTYDKNVDKIWDFTVFKDIANKLYPVISKGGVIVWVVGDATINGSETGTSFRQALYFMDIGFKLHDTMIYEKTGMNYPQKNRYHQIFEYMFIFSKGKPKTFNPIKDRKNKWSGSWGKTVHRTKDGKVVEQEKTSLSEYGMRFNIWRITNGKGFSHSDNIAYKHPATFPEQLAYDHIISWSNPNDIVLDPFMGSGTTAIASEQLGRRWIGIELNPDYCEITKQRILNYKSNKQKEVIM